MYAISFRSKQISRDIRSKLKKIIVQTLLKFGWRRNCTDLWNVQKIVQFTARSMNGSNFLAAYFSIRLQRVGESLPQVIFNCGVHSHSFCLSATFPLYCSLFIVRCRLHRVQIVHPEIIEWCLLCVGSFIWFPSPLASLSTIISGIISWTDDRYFSHHLCVSSKQRSLFLFVMMNTLEWNFREENNKQTHTHKRIMWWAYLARISSTCAQMKVEIEDFIKKKFEIDRTHK